MINLPAYFWAARPRKGAYEHVEVEGDFNKPIVSYYLWNHKILEWDVRNNTFMFNNCGYATHTTHSRLSDVLAYRDSYTNDRSFPMLRGLQFDIVYSKGRYIMNIGGQKMPYELGKKVFLDGRALNAYGKQFDKYAREQEATVKRLSTLRMNAFKERYDFAELEDMGLKITEHTPDYRDSIQIQPPADQRGWRRGPISVPIAIFRNDDGSYRMEKFTGDEYRYSIVERGFDTRGSVIYKVIVRTMGYSKWNIERVALFGKEYTGQWWLHFLPPLSWLWHIDACERWLLGIPKDAEILGIA